LRRSVDGVLGRARIVRVDGAGRLGATRALHTSSNVDQGEVCTPDSTRDKVQQMFYTIVLIVHSWARWAALGLGAAATVAALGRGDVGSSERSDRFSLFFMMVLDIQMLLGLLLYLVLSPFTAQAITDFGAAMRTPALRFWAVDHAATMMVAVVVVHLGRVLARRAATSESKRWRLAASAGLATLLMLIATPWPGLPNGRPLFRV
jgi:hypothetical protein